MTLKISSKDKLRRRFISLEEKLEILDWLKSGDKLTSVCKKFNINESTIRTILAKIRTRASAGGSSSLKKSSCNSKSHKVQKNLIQNNPIILHPPKPFQSETHLRMTWFLWKKEFLQYIKETNATKDQWNYIMLNHMGPIGQDVRTRIIKNSADRENLDMLLDMLDKYCIFGSTSKLNGHSSKKYIAYLQKLAIASNTSNMDMMIKKKVMDEIDESEFTKAAVKLMPSFSFSTFLSLDINEIAFLWDKYESPNKYLHTPNTKNMEHLEILIHNHDCCGITHYPRQCPAFGTKCSKCDRYNHFRWKCRVPVCVNCKFCGQGHVALREKCMAKNAICSKCKECGHFSEKCLRKISNLKYFKQ